MKKQVLQALALSLVFFSTAQADAFAPKSSEKENTSSMDFTQATVPAPWCPSKRMMVATISGPRGASLRVKDAKKFTVYVGDAIVEGPLFRITAQGIQVCIAAASTAKVLAYGPDSKGRGIEFSSAYSPDLTGDPVGASLTFRAGSSVTIGRLLSTDSSPVVGPEAPAGPKMTGPL